MKILHVHNHYRSRIPSGENKVVALERRALREHGLQVIDYDAYNDEAEHYSVLGKARAAIAPVTGAGHGAAEAKVLAAETPDVLHVHNVYPLISPRIVATATRCGVPVVHTVHNYRHGCMAGTFYRDGQPCTRCKDKKWQWAGVQNRCASGSTAFSGSMLLSQRFISPLWTQVDRFIAISHSISNHLIEQGFDPDRIVVNYHGVPDPLDEVAPGVTVAKVDRSTPGPVDIEGAEGFLVVSRLEAPKGLPELFDAWARSGLDGRTRLTIVGDGELYPTLLQRADEFSTVSVLGRLDQADVITQIADHAVMVVPSIWREPFGLTAIEAMASGRPVLATDSGALAELVDPSVGWSVAPTVEGLAQGLLAAFGASVEERRSKAAAARVRYETTFRPEGSISRLVEIYRAVARGDLDERATPLRRGISVKESS